MTDKKLTDNEIIKALEKWIKNYDGSYVNFKTLGNALDLINRLQAENEQKDKNYIELLKTSSERAVIIGEQGAEIERLKEENENLRDSLAKKKFKDELFEMTLGEYKAEAYKECIEKVKDRLSTCVTDTQQMMFELRLDNLLKELVGENNG